MSAPATVNGVSVDPALARRLTNAGKRQRQWRATRDELIREASAAGGSLREIAALVGLTDAGVHRIIRAVPAGRAPTDVDAQPED